MRKEDVPTAAKKQRATFIRVDNLIIHIEDAGTDEPACQSCGNFQDGGGAALRRPSRYLQIVQPTPSSRRRFSDSLSVATAMLRLPWIHVVVLQHSGTALVILSSMHSKVDGSGQS